MRRLTDEELLTALNVITATLATLTFTALSVAPRLLW
jgi:hypothetical protein